MSKPFLSPTEQKTILSAYSKNFDTEFEKSGPYTYGTQYSYRISMCPEIGRDGKETGRILVNHYSYSHASLRHIPEFVDVWEREGVALVFKTRNLPGKDLLSAEEKIKALEEELEGYKSVGIEDKSFAKLKYQQYKREMDERWEKSLELYNAVVTRIHSYKEETDTYFRESPEYFDLVKERDDALIDLEYERKKSTDLEERLSNMTEKYLSLSKQPFASHPHNERGAGRKKDPERKKRLERVKRLLSEGMGAEEISNEMGIARSTCYKYIKEIDSEKKGD